MEMQDFKMTPELAAAMQRMKMAGMEQMAVSSLRTFSWLNRRAAVGGLVFAGDSITHNYPVYELFAQYGPLYRRGISGITAKFMRENLDEFFGGLQPDKVFLLIGINSIGDGEGAEETAGHVAAVCSWLKEKMPGASVYLESVLPVNEEPCYRQTVGTRTNEAVRALNDRLCRISGVEYLDLYHRMADESGNLAVVFTDDGMHPNMAGYEVMTECLEPYFAQ